MKAMLRQLIAQGKTQQVLHELTTLATSDTVLHNEVVLLSGRFNKCERDERMGLQDNETISQERNRIHSALLSVIDRLGENKDATTTTPSVNQPFGTGTHVGETSQVKPDVEEIPKISPTWDTQNWWRIIGAIGIVVGIVAGIAQVSGYSLKDGFSSGGQLANVTVFVEDKNHGLVLKKQGYILMDVEGGEAKKEEIDEKGAASFKNVKIGDKVRLKVDFSEPYHPLRPDSVYTVPKDGRIRLTVGLQHLGNVFGRVLYRDKELSGVIVSVGNLRDTTDDLGLYDIAIPESAQRQEQEVFFKKEGFKSMTKKAFPQTNQPLNVVMEK